MRCRRAPTPSVDYEEWDPRNDVHVPLHYGPDRLDKKAALKKAFVQRLGLIPAPAGTRRPLIGIVSRLAAQKGFDLLADALPPILAARDLQMVVLGTGEERYETLFASLQQRFPAKVVFQRGYDNSLAHWIEACCDIFLMPSRYEPCGLNQMYSLRYGTVPVVRPHGRACGLGAAVRRGERHRHGVVFDHYDTAGVTWAIESALAHYANPQSWLRLVQNAMRQEFLVAEAGRRVREALRARGWRAWPERRAQRILNTPFSSKGIERMKPEARCTLPNRR